MCSISINRTNENTIGSKHYLDDTRTSDTDLGIQLIFLTGAIRVAIDMRYLKMRGILTAD